MARYGTLWRVELSEMDVKTGGAVVLELGLRPHWFQLLERSPFDRLH
jgi:hypothetical protein